MQTGKAKIHTALIALALALSGSARGADQPIKVLILDGRNNHDWVAATAGIRAILEQNDRFTVDVVTYPAVPHFSGYNVVISNFNPGHTADSLRWSRQTEQELVDFVKQGGGFIAFHAANNAFLNWPEYNDMLGLLWRDKNFGMGLGIGPSGNVFIIPKGQGLDPGHGPRGDFEMRVLDPNHPITRGLPTRWLHRSDQLTHGQHGPAERVHVLTYAYSPVSRQGEPIDWVQPYGNGRVYVTLLGHTWKDEPSPNLEDPVFQVMLARAVEWATFGNATISPNFDWVDLLKEGLTPWEARGPGTWTILPDGTLLGHRSHPNVSEPFAAPWPVTKDLYSKWLNRQAWLYTTKTYDQFDLHLEYFLPAKANSGVSIRDGSRAHFAIGEPDSEQPELAKYKKTTPAHIGYEIQLIDDDAEKYPTGSIYGLVPGKRGLHRSGEWNSLDIESRHDRIRVKVNGQLAAEGPGEKDRPWVGPIGLQLHDQFTFAMFRDIRIRERQPPTAPSAVH